MHPGLKHPGGDATLTRPAHLKSTAPLPSLRKKNSRSSTSEDESSWRRDAATYPAFASTTVTSAFGFDRSASTRVLNACASSPTYSHGGR
jgi:hypothetical protein